MARQLHATMIRLYAAAKDLAGITNKSAIGRKIDATPQTLNNWEKRGISQRAANKAQAAFGVSATWLLNGTGPMIVNAPTISRAGLPGRGTASQLATLDPDILHEALVLLEFDVKQAGRYTPRAEASRLAELYRRVAADGSRLSSAHTAEFEAEVEARRQGKLDVRADEERGEGHAGRE